MPGPADAPRSLLETTLNTRDLGRHAGASGKRLQPWRILRSDVQNHPSAKDISLLREKRILTIIDMRVREDALRKPSGFADREGFGYLNIPISEGSGIPPSVEAVSGTYLAIAQSANMPRVFRAIADAPAGVMINCTAGKDRTGVVSAVLLGLCGVSRGDITADYMLTKACSRERFELIHRNFPDIDMDIVIPRPEFITDFLDRLLSACGSFRGYLRAIGLAEEEIGRLAGKLMEQEGPERPRV